MNILNKFLITLSVSFSFFEVRAECNNSFINAISYFNDFSSSASSFKYFIKAKENGNGNAEGKKLLNNVYAFKYDYINGSDGVFLFSYDFSDSIFYLSHINEGGGIYPGYFVGRTNEDTCSIDFVESGKKIIEVKLESQMSLKFLSGDEYVAEFVFEQ